SIFPLLILNLKKLITSLKFFNKPFANRCQRFNTGSDALRGERGSSTHDEGYGTLADRRQEELS
ncbi:MAG: hypothetical protein RR607_07805, partial [Akkermansia sp.]